MSMRILCLATLFFALSGCSSFEPHMKPSASAEHGRSLTDINKDRAAALSELRNTLSGIKKPEQATKDATDKVTASYNTLKDLEIEEKAAKRTSTPEEDKEVEGKFRGNLRSSQDDIDGAVNDINAIKPPPAELVKAIKAGQDALEEAKSGDSAPAGPVEIVATKPAGGTWAIWLLVLFILAACVGFLFREGIWSNALRLVNIVFAGLLTMNFYEPVAKFLTKPGDYVQYLKYDDLQTFTAFFDFLGFWICFVFFGAIFMLITDSVSRVRVRFLQIAERVGAPLLAFCIGWVMVGLVLVSLHMSPLGEYPFAGCFQPQASMGFGFLAPDREWLGFTKYQSHNGLARPLTEKQLRLVWFDDAGDDNLIDKNWKRRIEIENYVRGNNEHGIKVNPKFIKTVPANPPQAGK
jgi:uncharacterized membrane protein required for colicin V production